ncbi:SPARC-related modular calcium-binding protein 1-like isoform X2 [Gigantopelta aegis]|uniref:SPARC-related modular calcium-binding protein 1-like isoform X2 n=1 Tax=Gigantopelta aegis TaxID=1735272 RepID=UPI001B88D9C8|nr:SPARC-related modular calcium-binding protein 1-like isoform X2 [Gigantopelta aegis]
MVNFTTWSFSALSLIVTISCVTSTVSPQLAGVDGKSLFRSLRASNCQMDCSTAKRRLVCGTDGLTYSSPCELKRAKKCDGRRVKVRKKGRCLDPAGGNSYNVGGGKKCFLERDEANKASLRHKSEVFVPVCKHDGTFAEVQCHGTTGFCWCVTKDGRHIPATSVKGRRPRCRGKRRKRKQRGRPRKRKACSPADRQVFNSNLVGEFTQEYNRLQRAEALNSPELKQDSSKDVQKERIIVEWKYTQLDYDGDNVLRFKEIRGFHRMVKKLIKPKACAKRFRRFCDSNSNKRIEPTEWTLCLGIDQKFSFRLFLTLNSDGQTTEPPQDKHRREDGIPYLAKWKPQPHLPRLSSASQPKRKQKSDHSRSCMEERAAAKANADKEPNANIYIPACQTNGMWDKAQCHNVTRICWCVEQKTGMPIPGTTSSFEQEPNCTISDDRQMKGRIKGCPLSLKRRFLVDLMNDLAEEMAKATGNTSLPRKSNEIREKVAEWKLLSLDMNGNGVLDRKEWKTFRKTNLKNKSYPRKCRRNFLRYCDSDNNKKVTVAEWRECMGLNHNYYNVLPNNNRRGRKNPFIDQLT